MNKVIFYEFLYSSMDKEHVKKLKELFNINIPRVGEFITINKEDLEVKEIVHDYDNNVINVYVI